MKVSIVIPAFNNQALLDRSLATWAVQRDEFAECIVVDDGSDPPLKVPDWVRLIRIDRDMQHRSSSEAKNLGADKAIGDYLVFADSDILHMPDAMKSLKRKMAEWESEGHPNILLNVSRMSIPQGYPLKRTYDLDRLRDALAETQWGGTYMNVLENGGACVEQNCGMIRKDVFMAIGGYDYESLPSWGFNNQDLCLRVIINGGRVSSYILRDDGSLLACFHMWHENGCDTEKAAQEFEAKWGERWSSHLLNKAAEGKLDERVSHAG